MVEYETGINENTMENFDLFGWTFEYHFWNDECANYSESVSDVELYDITDNTGDSFNYTDACDTTKGFNKTVCVQRERLCVFQFFLETVFMISSVPSDCALASHVQVAGVCAQTRAMFYRCCNSGDLLSEVCESLEADCRTDVCIMATKNGVGNKSLIEYYANLTLLASLDEICNSITDTDDVFDNASLIEYEHVGCYFDNVDSRAMNFSSLNPESVDECIEKCYKHEFQFAGVIDAERAFRCYCTNDEAEYQVHLDCDTTF